MREGAEPGNARRCSLRSPPARDIVQSTRHGSAEPVIPISTSVALLSVIAITIPSTLSTQTSLRCDPMVSPSDSGSGMIRTVAANGNGQLAWSDGRSGQFLVRDASGRTRVVGRQGSGPGEFQSVAATDWVGDTLWVSDGRLPRVQFFTDTGRLLRVATAILPGAWGPRPDGRLVGFANRDIALDLPWVLRGHRPGSARIDTIAQFPLVPAERFGLPAGGQLVPNPQPLIAETRVGASGSHHRFCAATPNSDNSIRLQCVDSNGAVMLERRIDLPMRPVSDAIYDSVVALFARAPGRTEADIRTRIKRPRFLPPVLAVLVDNSGGVWLRRTHSSESIERWARITATGAVRDSIALPPGYRALRPDGDDLWATSSDDDGLQTLHRCRI